MSRGPDVSGSRTAADAALARGDFAAARDELSRLSQQTNPADDVEIFLLLAQAEAGMGHTKRALRAARNAVAYLRSAPGAGASLCRALVFLGCALADGGDFGAAIVVLGEADAIRRPDQGHLEVRVRWALARIRDALGDAAGAKADVDRAIELLERAGDRPLLGRLHTLASTLALTRNDDEEAEHHLDLADSLLGPDPGAVASSYILANRARIYARRGATSWAVHAARQALELARDSMPQEECRAWWALGEALAAAGDVAGADEAFARSIELVTFDERFRLRILEAWIGALQRRGGAWTVVSPNRVSVIMLRHDLARLRDVASTLRDDLRAIREEFHGSPGEDRRSRESASRAPSVRRESRV